MRGEGGEVRGFRDDEMVVQHDFEGDDGFDGLSGADGHGGSAGLAERAEVVLLDRPNRELRERHVSLVVTARA